MVQQNLELLDDRQMQGEFYLVGRVAQIFFQSSTNFYKVLLVTVKENNFNWAEKTITVTGSFAEIREETLYRFSGQVVHHPKYGQQFQAANYQTEMPTSKAGLVTYLSSSQFPGIGQKTAERIVDILGDDALNILLKDPSQISKLGLKEQQQEVLKTNLQADQGMEQIIVGLNSLGFSSNMAARIYGFFQEDTLKTLHEDPYQLSIHINGIGFYRADQIARQLGFAADAPGRLRGAIFQVLYEFSASEGNTYIPGKILLQQTQQLLQAGQNQKITVDQIADELIKLVNARKLALEDHNFYLKKYFYGEWEIATELERIISSNEDEDTTEEPEKLATDLAKIEQRMGIEYDETQKEAIIQALSTQVFLLTGGPGTGKTTIINGIVALYAYENDIDLEDKHLPILLAAPTGRAAKRMSEMTGLPASTIHRLLGINGHDDELPDEIDELDGTLLIIDETSMVDTDLMKILLKSIPAGMQVIFVGDRHQLPSVGPGQVFADMLQSNVLPKKELTKIYRQGEFSTIVSLAHAINAGQLPANFAEQQGDRSFIPCSTAQVPQVIAQVIKVALRKGNSEEKIQVLAPMYRGPAGIDNLNQLLQNIMNPKTNTHQKEIEVNGQIFRIGDRVLQLVNDPEKNIYNGDIGKIVAIDIGEQKEKAADSITVAFEQTEVEIGKKDWNNLTLAYCLSIHKSQGGEFPIVILPMVKQFSRMFARNLLYTAVTRAKSKLILVGDLDAFRQSVLKVSHNRLTSLKERLVNTLGQQESDKQDETVPNNQLATPEKLQFEQKTNEKAAAGVQNSDPDAVQADFKNSYRLTLSLIANQKIDPMIGMNGISPRDFMH
ncbi:exodeoxyribonuclease V subunit alpha [Ligilactobacillus salitolerans]|uniref:ATP-dependent RecD2 DNA helicase n=1 Tax=Ligilactobacillus salitolerans TaxID=1808352 RepID=A0A401IQV6_9LACO|nr:ATP-dependent RecD-like DNA helicase [Ligilactobacillus salitolerans]GBG93929.1 exodeoxyribonuclease V subunit alpha [Ligilactobacillus salitolerans]